MLTMFMKFCLVDFGFSALRPWDDQFFYWYIITRCNAGLLFLIEMNIQLKIGDVQWPGLEMVGLWFIFYNINILKYKQ